MDEMKWGNLGFNFFTIARKFSGNGEKNFCRILSEEDEEASLVNFLELQELGGASS